MVKYGRKESKKEISSSSGSEKYTINIPMRWINENINAVTKIPHLVPMDLTNPFCMNPRNINSSEVPITSIMIIISNVKLKASEL